MIAPYIAVTGGGDSCCEKGAMMQAGVYTCTINGEEHTCNSQEQCDSLQAANIKDISELNGLFNVDGVHSSVRLSV